MFRMAQGTLVMWLLTTNSPKWHLGKWNPRLTAEPWLLNLPHPPPPMWRQFSKRKATEPMAKETVSHMQVFGFTVQICCVCAWSIAKQQKPRGGNWRGQDFRHVSMETLAKLWSGDEFWQNRASLASLGSKDPGLSEFSILLLHVPVLFCFGPVHPARQTASSNAYGVETERLTDLRQKSAEQSEETN